MIISHEERSQITHVPPRKRFHSLLKNNKIKKTKADRLKETSMRFLYLFAKRFIAGETLAEALPAIRKKKEEGFFTTTDVLGESVKNKEMAKDAADDYCELVSKLKEENLEPNVSLKLTQLGLDISKQLCYENVCKVLKQGGSGRRFCQN